MGWSGKSPNSYPQEHLPKKHHRKNVPRSIGSDTNELQLPS